MTRRRTIAPLFLVLLLCSGRAGAEEIEDWDARFERAKTTSADQLESLAEWCTKNGMPFTANVVRYRILRFLPDHASTREFFGYERDENGAWWRAAAFREKFRTEFSDDERANREGFDGRHAAIKKRIAARLSPLAKKAEREAAADPDHELEWLRRMWAAWNCVLVVDAEDESAHRGLRHPKFEDRYVPSAAVPFLEARRKRAKRAAAIAKKTYELGESAGSKLMVAADVRGFKRRSTNLAVATTFGDEAAVDMVFWGERAIDELATANHFPAVCIANHKIRTIYIVSERDQIRDLLMKAGWESDAVEKQLVRFSNGYIDDGVVSWRRSEREGIDAVMHYATRSVVRSAALVARAALEDAGPDVALEAWLRESLASEVVRRLTGIAITTFSEVPDYAHGGRDTTGADQWMSLARFRVETDDDVALTDLVARKLNDLDGAATVKGYGFLQYLHERDAEQAQQFVWVALAKGSARAAESVWGESLEELDAGYREWVLLTW